MRQKRFAHGVAVDGTTMYVMGGGSGAEVLCSAEKIDLTQGSGACSWEPIAEMGHARLGFAAVAHNGLVYAIGGFNGKDDQDTVERYDPLTNTWATVAPMLSKRSSVCACVCKQHIYVIGGFDGLQRVAHGEVYDPCSNQWHFIPDMSVSRAGACCVPGFFLPGLEGQVEHTLSSMSAQDEKTELMQLFVTKFQELDVNNSGSLSVAEVGELSRWVYASFRPDGKMLTEDQVLVEAGKLVNKLDNNDDGEISFTEFCTYFEEKYQQAIKFEKVMKAKGIDHSNMLA